VHFGEDGLPSVRLQTLKYSSTARTISTAEQSTALGQTTVSGEGAAKELVREFFDRKTARAVQAFGPMGAPEPQYAADLGKKAILFAEKYATGTDKDALGGPIDVVILRKTGPIEWVSRKSECYRQDQKPL